jgi:enoyl-CoA hydratase
MSEQSMSEMAEPEVLLSRSGSAGIVTLNRPRQLNALTADMVRAIVPQMELWQHDAGVTRILIEGSGPKAFCAGGDIRALYDLGRAGDLAPLRAFWREEYTLNHTLKTYPKPIIALIDGIVMGGGVGMSFHGSHRVATEKLMFAMPEVGIGFFPDVGATYFLPRLPGHMGTYLALTGARIGQADALMLGLATHGVSSAALPALRTALTTDEPVDAVLARFTAPAPAAPLLEHADVINDAFGEPTLVEIMAKLGHLALGGHLFASEALEAMRAKSPTSQAIALSQMQMGCCMSFAEAMTTEFRIVSRIAEGHDFYEGVRALIIDKDNAPRWQPASIELLDPAAVDGYFATLADELILGAN